MRLRDHATFLMLWMFILILWHLSISFSPQLKTCHQARQTYEINPLISSESVGVCTSYFKAIVSRDSRHALARLNIPRRFDTRYTSTTATHISYAEHITFQKQRHNSFIKPEITKFCTIAGYSLESSCRSFRDEILMKPWETGKLIIPSGLYAGEQHSNTL